MKVIILSHNRPNNIPSYKIFKDWDVTILLHGDEHKAAYLANEDNGIKESQIIVTGVPPLHPEGQDKGIPMGKTGQMEWACKNLVKPDEWFVFADDNILSLTGVTGPKYFEEELPVQDKVDPDGVPYDWPAIFRTVLSKADAEIAFEDTVRTAEGFGAKMAGFALVDNSFFRGRKFRSVGYVIGKLLLWKNDPDFEWDHRISMEDFRNTCEHMMKYGAVCINNYLFPTCKHYQPGGLGKYEQRVPYRLKDVQLLLKLYPELLEVKDREGFVPNTDVRVKITSKKQLDKIRSMDSILSLF